MVSWWNALGIEMDKRISTLPYKENINVFYYFYWAKKLTFIIYYLMPWNPVHRFHLHCVDDHDQPRNYQTPVRLGWRVYILWVMNNPRHKIFQTFSSRICSVPIEFWVSCFFCMRAYSDVNEPQSCGHWSANAIVDLSNYVIFCFLDIFWRIWVILFNLTPPIILSF